LRLFMNTENTQPQPQTTMQPMVFNPPAYDTHMNWRVRKEARLQQKIAKHEWKQQKMAMKGKGMVQPTGPPPFVPGDPSARPHPNGPPVVPTFDPSARPFVPHAHHIPCPPYMQAHHVAHPYMHPHAHFPPYYQSMHPETLSEPVQYGKKIKDLDARFISHQSYPDDSDVPCGVKFEKTWRFRNTGLLKWPEGTVFLRVDRANELFAPDATPVTSISPNEETDVTVQMISPASAGRYQSYFKLCSPSGKKFGQRMRCQILSVSDSSISPERIDKVWEQLEAMGFVEKGKRPNNISSLILRENCDVARIVRELRNLK